MADPNPFVYQRYLQAYIAAKSGSTTPPASMADDLETTAATALGVRDAKNSNPIANRLAIEKEVATLIGK